MALSEVWIGYCQGRFPLLRTLPDPEPISPMRAVELFWLMHPLFTPRMDAINGTAYDTRFDSEADSALKELAINNSFDSWENMSAGAWRVMSERLLYAQTVAMANEAAGTTIIAHLPRGLDEASQSRALVLMFLLGGARTIDPRLLRKRSGRSMPLFPAAQTLRKQ